MKGLRNLAVAGCTVFLLCQCASQDDVRDLSYQIRAVNKKVEDVQSSTVNQIQKRQASSVNKLDTIQDEFLQLRAMVEESQHQNRLDNEKAKQDIADLRSVVQKSLQEYNQRLEQLEKRINALEGNLDRLSQARIREAEQRAREAAERAEKARQKTVNAAEASGGVVNITPKSRKQKVDPRNSVEVASIPSKRPDTGTRTVTPEPSATGNSLYDQGVKYFNSNRYTEAYQKFEQYISQNPNGDMAASTLFYMGESLYAKEEYDLAILDYQKVISNHAKHKRAPMALLKQGMSFENLTDHETAKIIYKKLISEYPDSVEAKTASNQLEKLQ